MKLYNTKQPRNAQLPIKCTTACQPDDEFVNIFVTTSEQQILYKYFLFLVLLYAYCVVLFHVRNKGNNNTNKYL